jgi:single-strand DNA-binding protein
MEKQIMKISGQIIHIGQLEVMSEKFKKREFVIQTEGQYPQEIQVQVTQDRCDLLNNLKFGDIIDASINIRGRSWTSKEGVKKWFNSIEAWSISYGNSSGTSFEQKTFQQMEQKAPEQPQQSQEPEKKSLTSFIDEQDDLPF